MICFDTNLKKKKQQFEPGATGLVDSAYYLEVEITSLCLASLYKSTKERYQ